MKILQTCAAAAAFAFAAVNAATPAADAARPISLKDFARQAEFGQAKVSPTGDYLAVSMLLDAQMVLGIIDLKSKKVSGTLRFPKGNQVADFDWVGPTRVVASVAKDFGPLAQPSYTGELYGIDADGKRQTYLFGYRGANLAGSAVGGVQAEYASAFVFADLPDDPQWALVKIHRWLTASDALGAREPTIERINVYNGRRERVTSVPGYEPLQAVADRQGRIRFSVSQDEGNADHAYVKADTPSGWKEVRMPGGDAVAIDLHGSTADGATVFMTTDDGQRSCLREYRVDTGALVERACNDKGTVGRPLFAMDDRALLGLRHEEGRPLYEEIDAKHPDAALMRLFTKTFKGERVRITSRSLDGKKLVVLIDSDRNPGDFYLVDRGTRKADYLLSRRSWIDPATMAPSEPVTYKSRDGATIHGFLTARGGLASRQAPLVLMPHGGPHGPRDYWQWDPWAQALASRGYAVLQVNFRGSGGYGEGHQRAGYRKWGTLMQDDLTDAVRWVVDQGIADPARICIMGGSYGGYAALMSAVREPDLYRCAIGLAGVYDLVSQSSDSDIADSRFGRTYLLEVLGDTNAMREQSPVTYIDRLKAPVLIAHGTADERVPFSQAKILRKALKKAGKPFEWAEYEDEMHGFHKPENEEDFLKKALAFLDKHIGPGAPAAKAP